LYKERKVRLGIEDTDEVVHGERVIIEENMSI
jgi:hypothetical protein